jgi:hypothetical protein
MSRLATEFRISDVALAKICKKLDVPIPGRGYWARVTNGQKVKLRSSPSFPRHAPTRAPSSRSPSGTRASRPSPPRCSRCPTSRFRTRSPGRTPLSESFRRYSTATSQGARKRFIYEAIQRRPSGCGLTPPRATRVRSERPGEAIGSFRRGASIEPRGLPACGSPRAPGELTRHSSVEQPKTSNSYSQPWMLKVPMMLFNRLSNEYRTLLPVTAGKV